MAEERITERVDAKGNITERVIERGEPGATTRGLGLFFGSIFLIAAALITLILFNMNTQETRKTEAISEAATAVSDGAQKVGEGAEKVGNAAEKAADKLVD